MTICPYGDPCCPCPDGDACHYEWDHERKTPPMPHPKHHRMESEMTHSPQERDALVKALDTLIRCITAAWEMDGEAIRSVIGNTNYNVVLHHVEQARAALAEARRS